MNDIGDPYHMTARSAKSQERMSAPDLASARRFAMFHAAPFPRHYYSIDFKRGNPALWVVA